LRPLKKETKTYDFALVVEVDWRVIDKQVASEVRGLDSFPEGEETSPSAELKAKWRAAWSKYDEYESQVTQDIAQAIKDTGLKATHTVEYTVIDDDVDVFGMRRQQEALQANKVQANKVQANKVQVKTQEILQSTSKYNIGAFGRPIPVPLNHEARPLMGGTDTSWRTYAKLIGTATPNSHGTIGGFMVRDANYIGVAASASQAEFYALSNKHVWKEGTKTCHPAELNHPNHGAALNPCVQTAPAAPNHCCNELGDVVYRSGGAHLDHAVVKMAASSANFWRLRCGVYWEPNANNLAPITGVSQFDSTAALRTATLAQESPIVVKKSGMRTHETVGQIVAYDAATSVYTIVSARRHTANGHTWEDSGFPHFPIGKLAAAPFANLRVPGSEPNFWVNVQRRFGESHLPRVPFFCSKASRRNLFQQLMGIDRIYSMFSESGDSGALIVVDDPTTFFTSPVANNPFNDNAIPDLAAGNPNVPGHQQYPRAGLQGGVDGPVKVLALSRAGSWAAATTAVGQDLDSAVPCNTVAGIFFAPNCRPPGGTGGAPHISFNCALRTVDFPGFFKKTYAQSITTVTNDVNINAHLGFNVRICTEADRNAIQAAVSAVAAPAAAPQCNAYNTDATCVPKPFCEFNAAANTCTARAAPNL
jgi:hypothetical protein